VEELLEGAAVWREQADVRAPSLSSSAVAIEKVASWGVNFSVMAVKCTATRADACVSVVWSRHELETACLEVIVMCPQGRI